MPFLICKIWLLTNINITIPLLWKKKEKDTNRGFPIYKLHLALVFCVFICRIWLSTNRRKASDPHNEKNKGKRLIFVAFWYVIVSVPEPILWNYTWPSYYANFYGQNLVICDSKKIQILTTKEKEKKYSQFSEYKVHLTLILYEFLCMRNLIIRRSKEKLDIWNIFKWKKYV